jgi:hypothetical protein
MKRLIYFFTLALVGLFLLPHATHAQVKIGANAKTIGSSSNLEIEAANGKKTIVDKATGQVTIQDGTEGAGKVLTSDGTGKSSWQSLTTQRIPETVWIGEQSGSYTITPFASFNQLKDRISLVPRTGSIPGYSTANKDYTIQTDGYYRIYIGTTMQGTGTTPGSQGILYLHPFGVLQQYQDIGSGTAPTVSTFWEGFMTAGTVVNPYVISAANGGGPGNQNITVTRTFMSITKLF